MTERRRQIMVSLPESLVTTLDEMATGPRGRSQVVEELLDLALSIPRLATTDALHLKALAAYKRVLEGAHNDDPSTLDQGSHIDRTAGGSD